MIRFNSLKLELQTPLIWSGFVTPTCKSNEVCNFIIRFSILKLELKNSENHSGTFGQEQLNAVISPIYFKINKQFFYSITFHTIRHVQNYNFVN